MEILREHYCQVGDCNSNGERAHFITQANLPKDQRDNPLFYIYLYRRHHSEQHKIGISSFCNKYKLVNKLDLARKKYANLLFG